MTQETLEDLLDESLFVQRERRERRTTAFRAPPYLTEEGFVLVDRREGGDRRALRHQADAVSAAAAPAKLDLVLERMQQLTELYRYRQAANQAAAGSQRNVSGSDWYQYGESP